MTEHSNVPSAATLFARSQPAKEWIKLKRSGKDEDNQRDERSRTGRRKSIAGPAKSNPQRETLRDELQRLRKENSALTQKLSSVEAENAKRVDTLEKKLQQAIDAHKEVEERLRHQLQCVQVEQKAAVDSARKVRDILSRVLVWVRQVQRSARPEHPPLEIDQILSPTDATYSLWPSGTSPSLRAASTPTPSRSKSIAVCQPPPAPGRSKVKNVPGKGFDYVAYNLASPSNLTVNSSDSLPLPRGISRADTPDPKRSLFAYCAQVVTSSLTRSPSSPKDIAAWKVEPLPVVVEDRNFDEETAQYNLQPPRKISPPCLAIGLM